MAMLSFLRIHNLAVISSLEVEFGAGLNVLTGETGSGKSIIVTALKLVLGSRGRADIVRADADEATVEALFEVEGISWIAERLRTMGLGESDQLVLRRVIRANGRTRAYANGRLIAASDLSKLTSGLVDISSQHAHHSMTDPKNHGRFLDEFGGLAVEPVREAYAALVEASQLHRRAVEHYETRTEREAFLTFQLKEIEQVDPVENEDMNLEIELERLDHAEALVTAAQSAAEMLNLDDRSLCASLVAVGQKLQRVSGLDPALEKMAHRIESTLIELEDVGQELSQYASTLDLDSARLYQVRDRLDALQRLRRRHGPTLADVLAFRDRCQSELNELTDMESTLEAGERRVAEALDVAGKAAAKISIARKKIAASLGDALCDELAQLGMGAARVKVDVRPIEGSTSLQYQGAQLTDSGIDRVEFLIAPNPGESPKPLRRVASGGELSRSLLALKCVLSGLGDVGLYVFDEVDAGVGGGIAEEIGRKLALVAKGHQVVAITHLPQVAIYANTHFLVCKDVEAGQTHT
ncbi:MAG: DNA repair protein RecN, partial [Proteobacteria bacterium]|nr:DNA repair protein RecN [Pseudomonadota bacterium]